MDMIQMARELGKAIQQEEAYLLYQEAQNKADHDQQLQDLIGKFNLKRMDLSNAMGADEQDQEKIDQLDRELKEIYEVVINNPVMLEVSTTKQALDKRMSFVYQILTSSVNGQDPDTIEEAASCTGSCSSCGGCH